MYVCVCVCVCMRVRTYRISIPKMYKFLSKKKKK